MSLPEQSLHRFCINKLAQLETKNLTRQLLVRTRKPNARIIEGESNRPETEESNRPESEVKKTDNENNKTESESNKTESESNKTESENNKPKTKSNNKELISFSCNDYLGLSQHKELIKAAHSALLQYGTSTGASRLVTGNHPLFDKLETALAKLKKTQDCVVFGSGYLTNIGLVGALAGKGDVIFIDELSHACLFQGAHTTKATIHIFQHNDMKHLETKLKQHRKQANNALILTDGVFSMDGDLANLPQINKLAKLYNLWVISDDAHGLGVVGQARGAGFAFNPPSPALIQMGTLSKAIGSYGGYVCSTKSLCDLLRNRARSLIYSTALPPANIAASIKAIEIITQDITQDTTQDITQNIPQNIAQNTTQDIPENTTKNIPQNITQNIPQNIPQNIAQNITKNKPLTSRPLTKAKLFCTALGLAPPQSPIVPLILKTPEKTLKASKQLYDEGFLVAAIRPPTVPNNSSRLRFSFCAHHLDDDILRLAQCVKNILTNI